MERRWRGLKVLAVEAGIMVDVCCVDLGEVVVSCRGMVKCDVKVEDVLMTEELWM